jgi:hypothetical protein
MLASIAAGHTVTLHDVDMGNLAPLLSNYIAVLDADLPDEAQPAAPLPWQLGAVQRDFPQAGLAIRGTSRYYAVLGASNGGVLKVFDREQRTLRWNDGGYVGQTARGAYITTQMTSIPCACHITTDKITVRAPFYRMLRSVPTPPQFLALRMLNMTVMRNVALGNRVKGLLVRLLMSGKQRVPLYLTRTITFGPAQIEVNDEVHTPGGIALRWLAYGTPFVGIHMASARYFEGFQSAGDWAPRDIDTTHFAETRLIRQQVTL